MERAVALSRSETLDVADLPPRVRDHQDSHVLVAADDPNELVALEEVERRYVRRVMRAVNGNKTLASRILGVDRKTLTRKLGPEA
jgi:transcriptional regulator of acetoin/glycerol metabolism